MIPVKDDDRLFACLDALDSSPGAAADLQIIVVDNGSAPAFRASLDGLPPRIEVLDEPRPGAFAARNRGVDVATGATVLFTDADCIPEPDWVEQALQALEKTGAGVVQGFSGTRAAPGTVGNLIQGRYGARFRRLRAGAPTECDTRNMAVRKDVFERLRFNAGFRRVGDTEFGLVAESLGFPVAYAPSMRVAHDHDDRLDTFIAKQLCHGWGAQRLMAGHPGLRWHSGELRFAARISGWTGEIPGLGVLAAVLAPTAVGGARVLQRHRGRLPAGLASKALLCLDKLAALSGHLLYSPGKPEPAPSRFLGRGIVRE